MWHCTREMNHKNFFWFTERWSHLDEMFVYKEMQASESEKWYGKTLLKAQIYKKNGLDLRGGSVMGRWVSGFYLKITHICSLIIVVVQDPSSGYDRLIRCPNTMLRIKLK